MAKPGARSQALRSPAAAVQASSRATATPATADSGATASGARDKPGAAAAIPEYTRGVERRRVFDELVMVFVLVMFVKMFIVELYKIPSGSMTPTLLGGPVAHVDVNNDHKKDIVFFEERARRFEGRPLVFVRQKERYVADPSIVITGSQAATWERADMINQEFDRILVNKLAYWFRPPLRGEIVVFKVPPVIYKPEAPIYIKRLVGEPGDAITFTPEGRLEANGTLVEKPDFFQTQRYRPTVDLRTEHFHELPTVDYSRQSAVIRRLERVKVPGGEAFVLGDNTEGSLDSRYWGNVPLPNFKGRAFLRVWPVLRFGFLK